MRLTERIVRDAKATRYASVIWDGQVTGLGLQITPRGRKSYVIRFKAQDGKRWRQAIIGRASEISLSDARERARRDLDAIRDGEADPFERREEAATAPTVADLVERFLTDEAPRRIALGRLKASTVEIYSWQANRHVVPAIGSRRVADVTRGDVERVVSKLAGPSRNGVLALLSRLFNLAERWEWRPQHSNPVRGVERARQDARDRVLSPSELAALAAALNEIEARSPINVQAIRFAALTGLRIGEVLAVRWAHVDFETGRLTMPETKTGRRTHDLPTAASAVLASLPRIGEFAFSNTDGRTPATYKRVRETFARAAKAAGLEDVRLHDLRRGIMTAAAASGASTHVLRDMLGHKTTAMADAYVRSVSSPVRDAREAVAGQVAAIMAGEGEAEVVPLRKR